MLSEMRKYRLGFTIAHQYLHQLKPDIRHAVLGNTGSLISFRVGAEDAAYLSREFSGVLEERDLVATSQPSHLSQAYGRRNAVRAIQRCNARCLI
jgi:hypothetical protein